MASIFVALLFICSSCTAGLSLRGEGNARGHIITGSNSSGLVTNSSAQPQGLIMNTGRTTTATGNRPPRVYFLFLAVDKVSNLDIWNAFFQQADSFKYRAYVHCKLPECTSMVTGSPLLPVPTVPSYYCTDLVSPMNQLLSYALSQDHGDWNHADKFVFLSDSTLPAKPFHHVYETLTSRAGSDFCVFPSVEWADVSSVGGLEVAAKHHQWITLDRNNAEKASSLWSSGHMHGFMSQFNMNGLTWTSANQSFADQRNWGCLDEFWHMVALYGTFKGFSPGLRQTMNLQDFAGGPLVLDAGTGWQGQCDTFVVWAKYLDPHGTDKFSLLHNSLDEMSRPHSGNDQRPGWWDSISSNGIMAIRSSDFLFVRKFIDKPKLVPFGHQDFASQYTSIVFR